MTTTTTTTKPRAKRAQTWTVEEAVAAILAKPERPARRAIHAALTILYRRAEREAA